LNKELDIVDPQVPSVKKVPSRNRSSRISFETPSKMKKEIKKNAGKYSCQECSNFQVSSKFPTTLGVNMSRIFILLIRISGVNSLEWDFVQVACLFLTTIVVLDALAI